MKQFTAPLIAMSVMALTLQAHAAVTTTPTAKTANTTAAATNPNTNPPVSVAIVADDMKVSGTITPGERKQIESIVHDYLIQKPEVLVEALQILQQRQMQEAKNTIQETQKVASGFANPLFHQSTDPVAGNPNGKVTVVEFFDYQCPHCVDMAPVMDAVIKNNPHLRVVYKDFPIRGPASEMAARAALAANLQGKYPAFSHALLTANQPLTMDNILAIAKNSGLDVEKLKKDMNSPAITKQIKETIKLAAQLKLLGTPAIFIANTSSGKVGSINYIPGSADEKQLQVYIDQASN